MRSFEWAIEDILAAHPGLYLEHHSRRIEKMPQAKNKAPATALERMLDEASWLLSHAQALSDYGRHEEAAAEMGRAAICEEQVACLLEADGQETEAAIHRVSAASCWQKLGESPRAVTLLRAAMSAPLRETFLEQIRKQWTQILNQARQDLKRAAKRHSRKHSAGVP